MENNETRIENLEVKINSLLTLTHFTHELIQTVAKLSDENFSKINGRIDHVEQALTSNFNIVGTQLSSIEGELNKINLATRYEEEYANLKIVKKDQN